MRRKSQPIKFMVLIKGRQPKQDFGEGVHDVRANKIWLSPQEEVAMRHVSTIPPNQTIGGVSIPGDYSRFLSSELENEGKAKHELIAHERSLNGLLVNTVETNGDPAYYSFPNQELAQHHATLMSNHDKKATTFAGLGRAFRQANSDGKGVITVHPHAYKNLMATRDTLRHEATHDALNQIVPNWQDHLFGEGNASEQLLKDVDVRDAIHNLIPSYGTDARTLHNELLARLGNREGLRDLRLDPNSDRYLHILSKVLDKGVEHHGQDFYRLFAHSAPVFRNAFYSHLAGHQSHPDYGVGVSDVHRGKIFLTHDGKIGSDHVGISTNAQGKISADRITSLLNSLAKERDAAPYTVHQEPTQYTPGHPHHYSIVLVTATRPERHAMSFNALLSNAKRHIELMSNPDLKRDLFHGLHRAIGEASEQSNEGSVKIIEPIGMPQWKDHAEMSKATRPNRSKQGFVYAVHPDWNQHAHRRLKTLLDAHKQRGHEGMRRAWRQILAEGGE